MTIESRSYMKPFILLIIMESGFFTNGLRKFPVFPVDVCPDNKTDWEAASMRLNCTIESKDYKKRYHCVATRDRSQLVEFCYPQTRSLYGIGQCVIFDSSFFLDNYTCLHFTYGCPDEHYFTDELYNYPSCFRIEPVLKCFMSEEKCLKNRATTTERKEVSTSQTIISQNHTIQEQEGIHLVPVLAPLITILGIISGIVVFATIMWKRKRCKIFFRRKHPGINDYVNNFEKESLLNNEHDREMLQLHNFKQENTDRKDSITLPEDQVGLVNDPDISKNSNRNKEITITTDKHHQDDAMYTKCIHEEGLKEQKTSDEHGGEMLLLHNVNQEHTNRKENITLPEEYFCLENDPDISENWNANKAMTITTDKYHQDDAMYTEYIHEVLKEQKKKDYGFLQYKRRQDFALNLCKTSYLQRTELEKIMDNTKQMLVLFEKEMRSLFVTTRASENVMNVLKKKRCVFVRGNPGDGKTTLTKHILVKLRERGMKPIQILSLENFHKIVPSCSRMVIFLDDMFGRGSVSTNEIQYFNAQKDLIKGNLYDDEKGNGNMFIATLRSDIYRECENTITDITTISNSTVDLSDNDNRISKAEFEYFVSTYELQNIIVSVDEILKIRGIGCAIGVPQCFTILKKIAESNCNIQDIFEDPLKHLQKEIRLRIKDKELKTAVLIYILLCGGSIKDDILNSPFKDTKRKEKALKIMKLEESASISDFRDLIKVYEGSYVEHDNIDNEYRFTHSSVQESIFLFLCQNYPKDIISDCDPSLLLSLSTTSASTNTIKIDSELFPDIIEKIKIILEKGKFSEFRSVSLMTLWHDDEFTKKVMQDEECKQVFVRSVDEKDYSMLVHFSEAGNIDCVKHLLSCSSEKQSYMALNKACSYNHEHVVGAILETGVKYDLKTCFYAVQSGNAKMLFRFTEKTDLEQIIFSNDSKWNFLRGGLLHEICYFGQNQLIDPLLERYPSLVHVRNEQGGNALHFVAFAGQIDAFKKLINKGMKPFSRTHHGSTVLHYACQNGKIDMVRYICDLYPALLTKSFDDFEGENPLHFAAQSGNIELYNYLLEKKLYPEVTKSGKTVLHFSCEEGHLELCKHLIEKHPNLLKVVDNNGITVAHSAAMGGSVDIFRFLIEKGLDVNKTKFLGKTVLHFCCMKGKFKMCKYLVKFYPGLLNVIDNDGFTVLHDAAMTDNLDLFSYLVSVGMNVNDLTRNGKSVLHISCMSGNLDIFRYLVENYPKLFEVLDHDGETVLHDAAWGGNVDVFKFLIDKGLDGKHTTNIGKTVLHQCCMNGKLEMCKYLVTNYPDLLNIIDNDRFTVLHDAAKVENLDLFSYLISVGLNVSDITGNGKSVLHISCQRGHLEICKYLVENYPKLLAIVDNDGETVLHDAAWGGNVEVFSLLIEKGLEVTRLTNIGETVLHHSSMNGKLEMCKYLVTNYPELLNVIDKDGFTALHDAAKNGNIDLFSYLLTVGINVNVVTNNGKSVLHISCQRGNLEMCKYLIENYPKLLEVKDKNGCTVLHDAGFGDNIEVFKLLIDKGLDVKCTTNIGKTALHYCCFYDKFEMCKYLVTNYPDLLNVIDNDGYTVLHDAAKNGNIDIFSYLISVGLNVSDRTRNGESVLHISCQKGQLSMCKYIVENYPKLLEIVDNNEETVLHDAVWGGSMEVFKFLIEKGFNLKSVTKEGKTVLHHCCMNAMLEMCKYLINEHSDLVEISDNQGRTVLHDAAWGGNVEVFEFLIDKGLDVKSTTNGGETVLHQCCMNGKLEMCKYLVTNYLGLLNVIDNYGYTVLHDAARGENFDLFSFLISVGMNVNDLTNNGKSVLHLSCERGHFELCKYLVENYFELLEVKDKNGCTVLHAAGLGGNVDVFKLLIDKGLDVKCTTNIGKTVLHNCCFNGKLEMCKYLVNNYPDLLNVIDNDGYTILHDTAKNENLGLYSYLLTVGMNFSDLTNNGKSILHISCGHGQLGMYKFLVEKYPQLLELKGNDESTVLHDAAFGGNVDVFKLLIDKGLEVKNTTTEGKSVLHRSCMNGQLRMSTFLISHYPNLLYVKDTYNENALPAAARGGNVDLFKFLIDKGPDINCSSRYGKSMLHWSCRNGKKEMSRYLVSVYPDLLGSIDNDGMNVLHDAAFGGDVFLFEFLIGKGLDENNKAYNGKTVLHWCCRNGEQAMFKYLNNKYSHFLHLKDDNDENVLHDAAWGGNINLFKLVMEEGFDVYSRTKKGKTVLNQSCRNGKFAMCKYLVRIHPELVKCIDNDGGNLLHDAAWGGAVEVFKFVLEKGLDVYSETKKGKTILHQSSMNGEVHMCKFLISCYPDLLEHIDSDGESVLHDAAFGGNIYLLNFLIDKGLDVNHKTNKGKTVLHKCCINGKVQMCKYLVNHQPQLLTVQDNDGVNALHDTAIGGDVELFNFLMEKGLNVHNKTSTGQTVLHLCCHVGEHVGSHVDKQAIFDYLIESYTDLLDVVDNEGNTVLHIACVQNQTKICRSLVEKFPDLLEIENKNGEKVVVCLVDGKKHFKMTNKH